MRPAEGRLHRGIGWNDESRRSQQEQDPWGPRLRGIVRCPRTMQRIPRKARLEDSKFGDFALVLNRVTARASRRQQSKRRVLPYLCLGVVWIRSDRRCNKASWRPFGAAKTARAWKGGERCTGPVR